MASVDVYFSLGSNVGNRMQNIMTALEMMDEALDCHYVRLSEIIETEPWGFSSNRFLNCAVLYTIECESGPKEKGMQILDICKRIEKTLGREENVEYDRDGNRIYHARTIDIDVLYFGTEEIKTEKLTVPHPLIMKRDFVKIPLRQIAGKQLKIAFPELFIIN